MSSRIPYLSFLIPSDFVFWHSLDYFEFADGDDVDFVPTEGWEAWELFQSSNPPTWRSLPTGERYVEFGGADNPLQTVEIDATNVRHIFIVGSFDGATFDAENGLISPLAGAQGILAGAGAGTTKFFEFTLPSLQYRKSGVPYLTNNMQAPMNDVPELIEVYYPTGFSLTDLQIGRDRDFAPRLWKGQYHFSAGFDRQLSSVEVERLRLYANLRSHLWRSLGQTLQFPTPQMIFDHSPTYSRFKHVPMDYEPITHSHTYEDERRTFNRTATTPPRRWEVEFNGITAAQAQVLDAFNENVGIDQEFDFYDYRRGINYTGVRIKSYERNHDGHQSWRNNCRFELVKY